MVSVEQNRQQFEMLVRQPDADLDLSLAALLVAREEYPSLDPHVYLERLDRMAAEARDLIGAERHPLTVATGMARYLFAEQGFSGDGDGYFDPRASYLNDVLDRRRGIPLSLSLVYLEVARRAGFSVEGVGLPGHFVVKLPYPGGEVLIDPFSGGKVLAPEDCAEKVREIYGGRVDFQPFMLGAVTKRQILSRGIHNLKTIYAAGQRFDKALGMVELLLIIAPWDLDEIRDRGMLRFRAGDVLGAVDDLETYLEYSDGGGDRDLVRRNVRALRKILHGRRS